MLPFGWICSTDVTNTWTKMTVLFIIFPSLKHESLSISVSLSSVLPPKHFHSTVTIFKFYPSSQGVHSAYLLFPCLFLIFFLLMHCPPWNHHGNNPMQKKKKKKCEREVSNSIYFSGISPLPFFHISGCFYPETVVWTASGRWEPHGLFTQGIHKANFSLMKPIVLDSFS